MKPWGTPQAPTPSPCTRQWPASLHPAVISPPPSTRTPHAHTPPAPHTQHTHLLAPSGVNSWCALSAGSRRARMVVTSCSVLAAASAARLLGSSSTSEGAVFMRKEWPVDIRGCGVGLCVWGG